MTYSIKLSSLRFLAQAIYANPERTEALLTVAALTRAYPEISTLRQELSPIILEPHRDREVLRREIRDITVALLTRFDHDDAAYALEWAIN